MKSRKGRFWNFIGQICDDDRYQLKLFIVCMILSLIAVFLFADAGAWGNEESKAKLLEQVELYSDYYEKNPLLEEFVSAKFEKDGYIIYLDKQELRVEDTSTKEYYTESMKLNGEKTLTYHPETVQMIALMILGALILGALLFSLILFLICLAYTLYEKCITITFYRRL